jgi:hypothetical protein
LSDEISLVDAMNKKSPSHDEQHILLIQSGLRANLKRTDIPIRRFPQDGSDPPGGVWMMGDKLINEWEKGIF